MALAYPEGEVFFSRKGLNSPNAAWYQADNPEHFYSHLMLEYVWNVEADHGSRNANSSNGGWSHPRSGYGIVRGGGGWKTDYGNWKHLPFSYGGIRADSIKRRVSHNLCQNGDRFKTYERGASAEAWFMQMPMPTKEEGWVYIDRLAHIRAIYIPIAYTASDQYPDLCAFLHVNFTRRKEIKTRHYEYGVPNNIRTDKPNETLGLMVDRNWALAINVHGLINLLSLPRQLRSQDPYSSECIVHVHKSLIRTVENEFVYNDSADFDWTKVSRANTGLDIQWKPEPPPGFSTNFFKNLLTEAAGFIPFVGPIAAIALPLAWTAIFDPDSFVDELIDLVPGMALNELVIQEIKSNGSAMRQYLPGHWRGPRGFLASSGHVLATESSEPEPTPKPLDESNMVMDLSFQLSDIILKHSGRPASDHPEDESLEPTITIADVPPTEGRPPSESDPVNNFGWAKDYIARYRATKSLPQAYIENLQSNELKI